MKVPSKARPREPGVAGGPMIPTERQDSPARTAFSIYQSVSGGPLAGFSRRKYSCEYCDAIGLNAMGFCE